MAFAGYFVFSLLFLIPFIVGLIVGVIRKDRFAWILMLCLIIVVFLAMMMPMFGLGFGRSDPSGSIYL